MHVFATLALLVLVLPACVGNVNTFGTTASDDVYVADHPIQEWSVWTPYFAAGSDFDALVRTELEAAFEISDLTINEGPRNTIQDVRIIPIPTIAAPPGVTIYGQVGCAFDLAAIYGAHHHEVCDKQNLIINAWSFYALPDDAQRRSIIGHEFGHTVGLRHSNTGSGVAADGSLTTRVNPEPTTTLMMSGSLSGTLTLNIHEYQTVNLHS
jgi:hypothetical protein